MTDDLKLVERLRAHHPYNQSRHGDGPLVREAADAIERLVREVESVATREAATVKAAFRTQDDRDRLAAQVEEMREVLESLLRLNDNHSPFGGEIYRDRVELTWDRVRALLQRTQEQVG